MNFIDVYKRQICIRITVINRIREETSNSPTAVSPTVTSENFMLVTKKTTTQTPDKRIYPDIPSRYNIKKKAK